MFPRLSILFFLLLTLSARAQETDSTNTRWETEANLFMNFIPGDFYLMPVIAADHGRLHLETRYNYEDRSTVSIWGGYNFSLGKKKLTLEATPMLGLVTGNTDGIAPGVEFTLSYWKLSLYHESQYLFSFRDSRLNYYYQWSELGISPRDWFTVGITAQKTKAFKRDLEIERGIYGAFYWKRFTLTGYYFSPFSEDQFFILGLSYAF